MRSFKHWTPTYIRDRLFFYFYEKTHPDYPWLTPAANRILESYLTDKDVCLEFGSGRSSIWFAKRVAHLTSVEHDDAWKNIVRTMFSESGLENIDYQFFPKQPSDISKMDADYVNVISTFADNSLDFCLVDGIYRDACALAVIDKLKSGGILVIDNVNWYLPSGSKSPSSRSIKDGPSGEIWQEVYSSISGWRTIWTTSGVTDTAIFFKP